MEAMYAGTQLDLARAANAEGWRPATVDRICRSGYAMSELGTIPMSLRLSLEMASQEESERRALEGELAELEATWRRAEEIAAIADDLLIPASARAFLERHRPKR